MPKTETERRCGAFDCTTALAARNKTGVCGPCQAKWGSARRALEVARNGAPTRAEPKPKRTPGPGTAAAKNAARRAKTAAVQSVSDRSVAAIGRKVNLDGIEFTGPNETTLHLSLPDQATCEREVVKAELAAMTVEAVIKQRADALALVAICDEVLRAHQERIAAALAPETLAEARSAA